MQCSVKLVAKDILRFWHSFGKNIIISIMSILNGMFSNIVATSETVGYNFAYRSGDSFCMILNFWNEVNE